MGLWNNEKLTPMVFGSANPSLHVEWSISPSASSALLDSPLAPANVHDAAGGRNRFSVRVRADSPGEAVLRVRVRSEVPATDKHGQQIFRSHVLEEVARLTIVEELLALPPASAGAQVFVTPNARLKLNSNRVAPEKAEYRILVSYFSSLSLLLSSEILL
jgi:hypothetical protein